MAAPLFQFLHGRQIAELSSEECAAYEEFAFRYWRRRGFPVLTKTDAEVRRDYTVFAQSRAEVLSGHLIMWSPLGLGLANSFHPHMWTTKCARFRTPMEVFKSDQMFRDGIHRALRLWPDRRPVSPNNVRRILSTYRNTKRVSNFRPTAALALMRRYSQDNDLIVDPAAGYGGRLLGCLPLRRRYLGIEPNRPTFRGLRRMVTKLELLVDSSAEVDLRCDCAEAVLPGLRSGSAALVICSPPYFSRERYSDDHSQSWVRYKTYAEWKGRFLSVIVQESWRILRPGGFLLLNVADTESHAIAEDAREIARRHFHLHYTHKLHLGSVPYHRNGNHGGFRTEPVYAYRR